GPGSPLAQAATGPEGAMTTTPTQLEAAAKETVPPAPEAPVYEGPRDVSDTEREFYSEGAQRAVAPTEPVERADLPALPGTAAPADAVLTPLGFQTPAGREAGERILATDLVPGIKPPPSAAPSETPSQTRRNSGVPGGYNT